MKKRFWIALLYGLTTLLVQGLHDHHDRTDQPVPTGIAGCEDPRPHYSGHGSLELTNGDVHCPACQFRADHQVAFEPLVVLDRPSRRSSIEVSTPLLRSTVGRRSTCRAPPLV